MRRGYIKLYRKIRENPLWKERGPASRLKAWTDLLMEAWHDKEKPKRELIDGKVYEVFYAQVIWSIRFMAHRWEWSNGRVDRFLRYLAEGGQITIGTVSAKVVRKLCEGNESKTSTETSTGITLITILNYDTYHSAQNTNEYSDEYANGTPTSTATEHQRVQRRVQKEELESIKELKEEKQKTIAPTNGSEPEESPFVTIILSDKTEHPIYQTDITRWQEMFPAVEVSACVKRIDNYFRHEKPLKRKTSIGIERSIVGWLGREQDRGGGTFKRGCEVTGKAWYDEPSDSL